MAAKAASFDYTKSAGFGHLNSTCEQESSDCSYFDLLALKEYKARIIKIATDSSSISPSSRLMESAGQRKMVATEEDYVGTMEGIRIGIPEYYQQSSTVRPKATKMMSMDKHTIQVGDFTRNRKTGELVYPLQGKPIEDMLMLEIPVRQTNLKPILNEADLRDWGGHFLIPYEKNKPEHRWLDIVVMSGVTPKKQFDSDMALMASEHRDAICDDTRRYGLRHCTVPESEGVIPQVVEYYVDDNKQNTYIRCISYRLGPHSLSCTHYANSDIKNSSIELWYSAEEQISSWAEMERVTREIVRRHIIQNQ